MVYAPLTRPPLFVRKFFQLPPQLFGTVCSGCHSGTGLLPSMSDAAWRALGSDTLGAAGRRRTMTTIRVQNGC